MNKVIFYGPLGKANSKVVGGGESGNLKTISILEKSGFTIIPLRKPYSSFGLPGKIKHILHLCLMPFLLFLKILRNSDVQVVHISGFYKQLILQEFMLIHVVKLLGKKCIYELRAGGVKESYVKGSQFYKYFFRKTVVSADVILVQGERYVELLTDLSAKNIVHYPNYIIGLVTQRKDGLLEKDGLIKLVYFGRIAPTKNILFMLDVCTELKNREVPYEIELIGEGDFDYVEKVKEKIRKENLQKIVKLSPPAFGSDLQEKLKAKHFFLFPSREHREGHSNSLTEAMALGIVPICSDYGFSREIVNSNRLIVTEFDKKLYSDLIIEIWKENKWSLFSKNMQEIVAEKVYSLNCATSIIVGLSLNSRSSLGFYLIFSRRICISINLICKF